MRRAVEKTLTLAEALSRAYALSHPLLAGDSESALRVVSESLNEWNVDWVAQKHRTYHKARPNRTPNKIILSRPALLQYIVCEQTTAYEMAQETAFLTGRANLTERTLLLRFVKHLLHESASRSFYVAVGICRVLHKYDHAMTKRFYAVLDQRDQGMLVDGELGNNTDEEYRRWKMILVDRLEYRFKEFVTVSRGPRNEKRFLPNDQSGAWSEHIRECLGLLTPWHTEHVLPPEFVPTEFNIPKLKCEGRQDAWDSAEENRMHTIIDPMCFSRLTRACGAPAPEQQLDVPQFKSVEHGPGDDGPAGGPLELTFAQAKAILDELDRRGTRRKLAGPEYMSVEVDGVERGRLDTMGGGLQLELCPESRQIQVFTTDAEGKLLLASLWLSLIDITPGAGWESSIVLEGGQRLGIEIKPVLNSAGKLESLTARISYEECNPLRILSHYFEHIRGAISERLLLGAALNHARSLQMSVYSRGGVFAALVLFAVVSLFLVSPPHNSRLTGNMNARAEKTFNAGGRLADSQRTLARLSGSDKNTPRNLWLDAGATKNQPAGPSQTFSQEPAHVVSTNPRSVVPVFTGVYPIEPWAQTWETPAAAPSSPQIIYDYAFAPPELHRGSERASGVGGGQGLPFFPDLDIGLDFVVTPDDSARWAPAPPLNRLSAPFFTFFNFRPGEREVTCAGCSGQSFVGLQFDYAERKTAGFKASYGMFDRARKELGNTPAAPFGGARLSQFPIVSLSSHFAFPDKLDGQRPTAAEGFSPDAVRALARSYYAFSKSLDQLDDADEHSLRNGLRVGSLSPGQSPRIGFSWRMSPADQRAKASTRMTEMVLNANEHADKVRPLQMSDEALRLFSGEVFLLFNDREQPPLGLRLRRDAALFRTSGVDMSRVKKTADANFVEQNETPPLCRDRAPGSKTPCFQLGVKFQF
jgi:hypothetical protein